MSGVTLRAVLVDHAPVLGGAERSLLHLAERLPAHGMRVEVVTGSSRLADEAERVGARVHDLDLPRLRSARHPARALRVVRRLHRLLTDTTATVAVANTVRAAPYVAAATRGTPVPFVWYVRDFSLSEARPTRPRLDAAGRRALQAAARMTIAVSHAVAAGLPSPARVVVIHNGVEIPATPAEGSGSRRRWQLPPNAPVAGVVGRLRPWKGQDRFLQALLPVAASRPGIRLLLAGSGADGPDAGYECRLRDLAREPGLKGKVIFCGEVDVPAAVYGALDVLVHAGDREPFGLAVAEAMSHGVPVVGFGHGALPELIDDGRTGLLVRPGDLRELGLAVAHLLDDDAERARLGAAARQAAAERFDAGITARHVAEALRRAHAS